MNVHVCSHHDDTSIQPPLTSKYKMLDLNEAYATIASSVEPYRRNRITEICLHDFPFTEESEIISAEDVFSPVDIPECLTSTVDGYAVDLQHIDIETAIEIIGELFPDSCKCIIPQENQCIYITTGSMLPEAFNCVLPVEYVHKTENGKYIKLATFAQNKIRGGEICNLYCTRSKGSDISKNEQLLTENQIITLHDATVLISAGIKNVRVRQSPTIGIISTGNELVDYHTDNSAPKGKVIDTNRFFLKISIKSHFPLSTVHDYGIINDQANSIEEIFEKAINDQCELLVASGGVSMGEKDYVKKVLEEKGEILFGRLNIKPGKPTTFGIYKSLLIFGLPGNPVSCEVCYRLLVQFSIECMSYPKGYVHPSNIFTRINADLLHKYKMDPERVEYVRGIVYYNIEDRTFYVEATGNQVSSRLKSFQKSNCLITIPQRKSDQVIFLQPGEKVSCLLISKPFQTVDHSFIKSHAEQSNTISHISKHYTVGTITISDRASKGEYIKDKSSEALAKYFSKQMDKFTLLQQLCVPDNKEEIEKAYDILVNDDYNLILTTGGTGITEKDITPEVTRGYIDKEASGISTYILMESVKITKFACLSRPIVGVKKKSLIVNLPGNPKAVVEILDILMEILPHALNQVRSEKDFH